MKTFALTAVMATLVAIPLILRKHREHLRVPAFGDGDDPRRYDIFDFVS